MTTKADAINGAMSVAEEIAAGKIEPGQLEQQLIEECRALVGQVIGRGDSLFGLQCEIARGVLAAGGIPADELSEWLAVARHRAGQQPEPPDPSTDPVDDDSLFSGPLSSDSGDPAPDA